MNALYVFIGGGLGSLARYLMTLAGNKYFHSAFPYATLLSNIAACFILGLITGLILNSNKQHDTLRLFIATGFCGGFSTFSTFTSETFLLFRKGEIITASTNIAASLILCFGSLLAGIVIMRLLSKQF